MKILLVQSQCFLYPWTGASKANRCLMEWFAKNGHECKVINPLISPPGFNETTYMEEKSKSGEIEIVHMDEQIHHIRIKGIDSYTVCNNFDIIGFIRKTIDSFQPDVTLVDDQQEFVLLETVCETKSRRVYIAHSQATLPFGPDSFEKKEEKTPIFQKLDGILTVSQFMVDYFKKWANLEATVIYFPSYGEGPFAYLASYDNPYVTVINPSAYKGYSIFVELAKRLPDVEFAAVPTWGTGEEELEEMRRISNITIIPPCENVDEIYRQTKVFLMPSLWGESFGQVVVEALLRGLPVIASNVGGLREAKLGTKYSLSVNPIREYDEHIRLAGNVLKPVVPEQDIEPWIQALEELLQDRDYYDSISKEAVEKANEFHQSLSFRHFESYLQRIIQQREVNWDDKKDANDPIQQRLSSLSIEKREKLLQLLKERRG